MEKLQFNQQTMINELVKSKHGNLKDYVTIGLPASTHEAEFLQRLITWNLIHGEIRDSKVALPVISLRTMKATDLEFAENAVANLMTLDPKNLVKAYRFSKELTAAKMPISGGHRKLLEVAMKRYLEVREANKAWWERTVLQHRASMKELYAVSHFKPSEYAQKVLFDRNYPKHSIFHKIREMKTMSDEMAAGTILEYKIPFQIALGALGRNKKELIDKPVFLLALMEGMSGQQLMNTTKFLTSLGVMQSPMLKSEYDKALKRAAKDKKMSTLKAGKAIEAIEAVGGIDVTELKQKLSNLQEQKIAERGIEGDWVVLGDCSGSMSKAIKMAVDISAYVTRAVKGKVYLIFFHAQPRLFDVTGKTLEEIKVVTRGVKAGGATSCGCGLQYLLDRNIVVNGIAIISDGGDNAPPYFHEAYPKYALKMGIEPAVYFYCLPGERNVMSSYCQKTNIPVEMYDMTKVDYYSLPNIVSMMKTMRYSLIDEIMNTEFLTLEKVFSVKRKAA